MGIHKQKPPFGPKICSDLSTDIVCSAEKPNSFPRALLEDNCELLGTDNVQRQISEDTFTVKWRLLCLLSFKYFSQHVQFWKLGNVRVYAVHVYLHGHKNTANLANQSTGNTPHPTSPWFAYGVMTVCDVWLVTVFSMAWHKMVVQRSFHRISISHVCRCSRQRKY